MCICSNLDRKEKKYTESSYYFLDKLPFCFVLLKSLPGLSFTSIPFSSEMSKRYTGTGIIRGDLETRRGGGGVPFKPTILSVEERMEASYSLSRSW